jgi:hypothetical protein
MGEGLLDEVETENSRESACILIPEDVIPDKKVTEQSIQLGNSGGNSFSGTAGRFFFDS